MTQRERLYRFIDGKRRDCGLTAADIPVEPMALAACEGSALVIESRPFHRRGLGGVLFKGRVSLITLNACRGQEETRFSLAHELVHYWCDDGSAELRFAPPNRTVPGRTSSDQTLRSAVPLEDEASAFSEWRANEGAAELLVPRAVFVPLAAGQALDAHRGRLEDVSLDTPWLTRTAALFGVTEPVIRYRLRSLRGRIAQSLSD